MKPAWLDKKINLGQCGQMKRFLRELKIETVCEQALCPNMGECFHARQATFLIMGRQCTRMCGFCNINKGVPAPVDSQEPARVAEAVEKLGLKHVVITSVTRDDLSDGGAAMFALTVENIRGRTPDVAIEILIPDFQANPAAIKAVTESRADIISHNLETVPSLYARVRRGADYRRSLEVLKTIRSFNPAQRTKSGIMLGLGETRDEVLAVLQDLISVDCALLSIGQYLAPSSRHYPVKEYVPPDRFAFYKDKALALGFSHVESAPYVRSSYLAEKYLK